MMQSVLGNSSKVLVDQKAGGNLLYLPLDKLMQQGAAAAPRPTPQRPAARRTAAPGARAGGRRPSPPRAREGLRSRER